MDDVTANRIEKLSKELGRTIGATALFREAKKRGVDVTRTDIKSFVDRISAKQLLAPGPPSAGKTATTSIAKEGSRWQADLIQYRFSADDETDDEEEESGDDDGSNAKKYALMLINLFDRRMHGVSIANKESETVLTAFNKLVKKLPEIKGGLLSTDAGLEFTNRDFQKTLAAFDIAHKVKGNGEVNAISVLDRAIGLVRKDVKARLLDNPEKTWTAVLGAAITAHNRRINSTMRDSPNDVGKEGNEELQFLQISYNAKK